MQLPASQLAWQATPRCISKQVLTLTFWQNHKIIFERTFSVTFFLPDNEDPSTFVVEHQEKIDRLPFGEYELEVVVQDKQIPNALRQRQLIQWSENPYRVNISDFKLYEKNNKLLFDNVSDTTDVVFLKMEFFTDYAMPLTYSIQIFKPEEENEIAVNFTALHSISSGINLQKGQNMRFIPIPVQGLPYGKMLIEVYFFEESHFIQRKSYSFFKVPQYATIERRWHELLNKFNQMKLRFPIKQPNPRFSITLNVSIFEEIMLVENYLALAQSNKDKLITLLTHGKPDHINASKNEVVWTYYKHNRLYRFQN